MKIFLLIPVMLTLLLSQQPQPKKDDYDPDKLGKGEIACGRVTSKKSAPCKCMVHRMAKKMAQAEACHLKHDNINQAMECIANIPQCPAVDDAETFNYDGKGNLMPAQCSRSCTKAKCECCKS